MDHLRMESFVIRASLPTLPVELLNRITSLLDCNSLIALKGVCRAFSSIDDALLWENLLLTLPRHYGALPLIHPPPSTGNGTLGGTDDRSDRRVWLEAEAKRSGERHDIALRKKVKQIIRLSDKRAWSLVKTVTMSARPRSLHDMFNILQYIRGNLQSLHIEAAPLHPFLCDVNRGRFPTIDLENADFYYPSKLPFLTHLKLSSLTKYDGSFVNGLCHACPNLTSLDIDFGRTVIDGSRLYDASWPRPGRTKIRRLRYAWDERYEHGDFPAIDMFNTLLFLSPDLEQLIVSFGHSAAQNLQAGVTEAIESHAKLRDVKWPVVESLNGGPKLRRLVCESHAFGTTLVVRPDVPALEELYIEAPIQTGELRVVDFPENPDRFPSAHTFPYWASIIRTYPLQCAFRPLPDGYITDDITLFDRLDALEYTGEASSGAITSIRNGENEVIIMTFLRQFVDLEDRVKPATPDTPELDKKIITYRAPATKTGSARIIRERIYQRQAEPTICTMTDYKGKAVPFEILQTMRDVAGDRVDEWSKRGVEVDSDVWDVLEEWFHTRPVK